MNDKDPESSVVWAVTFSNYEPMEIAALYDNREAAEQHVDQLSGDWRVTALRVHSVPPQADDDTHTT